MDQAEQTLTFTSQMASNLKDIFDEKFSLYKKSLQRMEAVRPEKISTNLETTVNQFFAQVLKQIDQVQNNVMSRLDDSKNLKELEQILGSHRQGFGIDLEKRFESGKQDLESSVQKGLYSTVVQQKDNYEQLIKQMESSSSHMHTAMDEGHKRIEKILLIKPDQV